MERTKRAAKANDCCGDCGRNQDLTSMATPNGTTALHSVPYNPNSVTTPKQAASLLFLQFSDVSG